jgi:hypothetical protein
MVEREWNSHGLGEAESNEERRMKRATRNGSWDAWEVSGIVWWRKIRITDDILMENHAGGTGERWGAGWGRRGAGPDECKP